FKWLTIDRYCLSATGPLFPDSVFAPSPLRKPAAYGKAPLPPVRIIPYTGQRSSPPLHPSFQEPCPLPCPGTRFPSAIPLQTPWKADAASSPFFACPQILPDRNTGTNRVYGLHQSDKFSRPAFRTHIWYPPESAPCPGPFAGLCEIKP